MESIILRTKLYVPRIPAGYVHRPFIYQKMDQLLQRKLCLISTPAGYGKTTLVVSWAEQNQQPLAWVSLDAGDNSFQRFFSYLVSAIQGIHANFGEGLCDRLISPQGIPNELFLIHLVNELARIERDCVIVLDDYHTLHKREIHEAIEYLLDNLPQNVHLVISSRTEPPISLANLRAKGQLLEIRYADLCFSEHDAGKYLNGQMKLDLDEDEIQELVEYTEGWIVGLHLAALALMDSAKTPTFLAKLNTATTYIVEYLLDEVLKLQPKQLFEFLLQTSAMERFTVELCDAALNINNSAELLAQAEHANLFIIQLDANQEWYRYHTLFAELLLARLNRIHPNKSRQIWQRVSCWFEEMGYNEEAIDYALRAEDYKHAASLIAVQGRGTLWAGGARKLLSWFESSPEEIYYTYPYLWTLSLWAYINLAQFSIADDELKSKRPKRIAEHIEDDEARSQFKCSVATLQALLSINWEYNIPQAMDYLKDCGGNMDENDESAAMFEIILGKVHTLMGNFQQARVYLERGSLTPEKNRAHFFRMIASHHRSELAFFQGNLAEFEKLLMEAYQIGFSHHLDDTSAFFRICIDIGRLHYERGNMVAAQQFLTRGVQGCKRSLIAYDILDGLCTIFEIALQENNIKAAEQSILNVEDLAKKSGFPEPLVSRAQAMQARLAIKISDWRTVRSWLDSRNIRSRSEFAFHERYEAHTAVQALAAFKETDLAKAILYKMIAAAEKGEWRLIRVNCMAWLAVIQFQEGNLQPAMTMLKETLTGAKQQGYVQAVLDAGEPMMTMLFQMRDELENENKNQRLLPYVERLIDSHEALHQGPRISWCGYDIPEPLTDRELEALELLAKGYPNRVIADKMVISQSTVKFHLKNVYLKLCVHTRTQAIAKAADLGLI